MSDAFYNCYPALKSCADQGLDRVSLSAQHLLRTGLLFGALEP
jgi:hypothetical protein